MKHKLNFFREAFGNVASSLYRGRLFVVFDKQISTKLGRIEGQGMRKENIVILTKNGIEQYYPPQLVAEAYHCDPADVGKIDLEDDPIDHNGHRFSKKELARFVADRLMAPHPVDPEVRGFIDKLRAACQ